MSSGNGLTLNLIFTESAKIKGSKCGPIFNNKVSETTVSRTEETRKIHNLKRKHSQENLLAPVIASNDPTLSNSCNVYTNGSQNYVKNGDGQRVPAQNNLSSVVVKTQEDPTQRLCTVEEFGQEQTTESQARPVPLVTLTPENQTRNVPLVNLTPVIVDTIENANDIFASPDTSAMGMAYTDKSKDLVPESQSNRLIYSDKEVNVDLKDKAKKTLSSKIEEITERIKKDDPKKGVGGEVQGTSIVIDHEVKAGFIESDCQGMETRKSGKTQGSGLSCLLYLGCLCIFN